MTEVTDPPAQTGATPTVPRDPAKQLLQTSRARWLEELEKSKPLDFSTAYMEASCFMVLATLENDILRKLRLMIRAQFAFQELAEQLESYAKAVKSISEELACKKLPEIMDQAELDEFTLAGGRKVCLEEKIHASLKKEDREEGCAELEKRGFATLVKRTISVPFTTRQHKLADKVVGAIKRALGPGITVEIEDEKAVHHATLSKWVREQLADGEEFSTDDMKLFGVHRMRRAVITDKKGD